MMFKKFAALVMAIFVMLVVASCSMGGSSKPAIKTPPPAPSSVAEETAPAPPPINEMISAFGETFEWADGLAITVSTPVEFEPTEWAMGNIPGYTNVYFTMVLTNNTSEPHEPMLFSNLASGGKEGSMIFDSGNPIGEFQASPRTVLLPGHSVEWKMAYSLSDPNSIILEVEPGFEYKNAIFTNVAP